MGKIRGNRRKAVINMEGAEMAPGTAPKIAEEAAVQAPPGAVNPAWNNRANRRARAAAKRKKGS